MRSITNLFIFFVLSNCSAPTTESLNKKGSFGYDVEFLKKYHEDLIILKNSTSKGQVAILPAYQGRVMTSTADGNSGKSFGWINHDLIKSMKFEQHINVFGGEDRFWIGPEGGQYAVFFAPESEFTFDNWFTPAAIDTEPFVLEKSTKNSALFSKSMHLTNHSGSSFDLDVERSIEIVEEGELEQILNLSLPTDLNYIGFQSTNKITNRGKNTWNRDSGMLSIWILGMFNPTAKTTVFTPYTNDTTVSPLVTDDYFGKVPAERLKVYPDVILFKGDGDYRSKFGLKYEVSRNIAASYSPEDSLLTIIKFSLPEDKLDYVNSLWKHQEDPFNGDVFNSYNDGPLESGQQLGPFYELESSSPAAALKPNESITHLHQTFHLQGDPIKLTEVTKLLFGLEVKQLTID